MIDIMNKNELNEVSLRFCLNEKEDGKDKINVIEIKNDGKYEIIKEVGNDIDDKYKNDSIQLEGFIKNRIILKRKIKEYKWLFYLLDVQPTDSNMGEYIGFKYYFLLAKRK